MNKTTTAIIVGTLVLTLGATVFIVKKVLGTNIKDSDFYIGEPTPPNLVVIRPTHFARREPQIGSTASFKNASGKIVTYM
ncbi:MAG TPA: hypothetical protein VFC85_00730, partial [Verrucomicrobiae bacterium]|nr:hypothetical protein [Verrucomicrobiae bacterium]